MSEDTLRGHRQDGAIDRAIDRAVRDIMSVEPPAGLRRRVLSRLDAPPPRATLLPWCTGAVGALAAGVLAVLLLRPAPAPVAPPVVEQAAKAPAASAPAPAATPTPQSTPGPASVAGAQTARRTMTDTPIRMPRIANVFGTPGAGVAAAAADIEGVVFPETPTAAAREETAGTPHPISVPQITIPPLQVERIRVEPMPTRK